jgi:NosR/NirI family transcriptional regulator, nitrous oxide reductase regulator
MRRVLLSIVLLAILPTMLFAEGARVEPPEFESDYKLPHPADPAPKADWWHWADVALLTGAILLASYLLLKKRTRVGVLLLTVGALVYFGFVRKGCICPIGAVQNVTQGIFDPAFIVGAIVLAFFAIPLVLTLLFGRTFCGAVCPLGAIQEVIILKPVKIPMWLEHSLGLLPWVYLSIAGLLAATGSIYLICQFDPFVGFFRFSAPWAMLVIGGGFLLLGTFIARPYCRFLCPYGAILRVCGRLSWKRVTITPNECVNCRLCEDACPFNAIHPPNATEKRPRRTEGKGRLIGMMVATPLLIGAIGWGVASLRGPLSALHPRVRLANMIYQEEQAGVRSTVHATRDFREGKTEIGTLYKQAGEVRDWFYWGGWIAGGFIGLVIGLKLIELSVHRTRTEYEADRARCLACGRCYRYCPIGHREKRKQKQQKQEAGSGIE